MYNNTAEVYVFLRGAKLHRSALGGGNVYGYVSINDVNNMCMNTSGYL